MVGKLRLTALALWIVKVLGQRRPAPKPAEELTEAEIDRLYGIPGEVLLERMGTYDFAPGAVDEMMAAIKASKEPFKRVPESDK